VQIRQQPEEVDVSPKEGVHHGELHQQGQSSQVAPPPQPSQSKCTAHLLLQLDEVDQSVEDGEGVQQTDGLHDDVQRQVVEETATEGQSVRQQPMDGGKELQPVEFLLGPNYGDENVQV